MNNLLKQAHEIAKALVEERSDIDIVLVYGSLARGIADELSDIDMLVVSDSVSVSWSFVLDDYPVSMHTMTWEDVNRLVKGFHGSWAVGASIIEHHKILWSKSEDVEKRYKSLARHIPNGSQEVLRKAVSNFTCLYGQLWRLEDAINHNDVHSSAFLIWNIAIRISEILSALNMTPMTANWGKQLPEITEFDIIPLDFENRYNELLTSPPETVLPIARDLIMELDCLVRAWFNEQKLSKSESISHIENEWSGIIDCMHKLQSAAKSKNLIAVRYAAVELAEFSIWIIRCLEGESSDPRHFKKTINVLEDLPIESQNPLETLLESFEIDQLVNAGKRITELLLSLTRDAGVRPAIAKTITEAKAFLRVKRN